MGFIRRFATTAKVEIPEGAKREAELPFIHQIVSNIEKHEIPASLVLNLDKTPMKYVPCGKATLEKQGTTTVPIHCVSDKRTITATFTITLDGQFLPMQLIYSEKLREVFPKQNFQGAFLWVPIQNISVMKKKVSNCLKK